jgi:hypothetical protein
MNYHLFTYNTSEGVSEHVMIHANNLSDCINKINENYDIFDNIMYHYLKYKSITKKNLSDIVDNKDKRRSFFVCNSYDILKSFKTRSLVTGMMIFDYTVIKNII